MDRTMEKRIPNRSNPNRMKHCFHIDTILILIALVSCTERIPVPTVRSGDSSLIIDASISPETKAPVTATTFSDGETMGLFVCKHEDGEPSEFIEHSKSMNNIRAIWNSNRYNGPGFRFNFMYDMDISFENLAITSTAGCNADIYAYAPYRMKEKAAEQFSPRNVKWNFSEQYDLMYARENGAGNRDLVPDGEPKDVKLHFEHALARIRVGVRCQLEGYYSARYSRLTLSKVSDDAGTDLFQQGCFDIVEKTFVSHESPAGSISVSNGKNFNASEYQFTDMLIIPTELKGDNELKIILTINGDNLLNDYIIKTSDVTDEDGKVGFRPGYTYTFLFDIDNYIRIAAPVKIDSCWKDDVFDDRYI